MDEVAYQHDYDGQTVLNPFGIIAIVVLGTTLLLLPRRSAVWPMIIMGCFVAPAQRIAIFTLNFDLLRVMVLFGTLRVLARGEWRKCSWQSMDSILVVFAVVGTSVYILRYQTLDAVKIKLGVSYDILGMYFLFRCLVRNLDDVTRVALGFAIFSVPVALAFLVERITGRNMFAAFGGVPAVTVVRDGRLRCQGAYAHPILAGCYWASVLPLMAALWWRRTVERRWAIVGVSCGLIIIVLCASSTPVSAVACGLLGAGFFMFRRHMRIIRWAILVMLVSLHLVMRAPVWSLIARFDLAGGSTGWHRFNLINQFVLHFGEWWLLGVSNVEAWGVWAGDVTNQYLLEGARGGIWTLGLLVALIVMAFSRVGRLWRVEERSEANLVMAWALGVTLFIHCISFIGVNYFGQINMVWYLTLATIASLSPTSRRAPALARKHAATPYAERANSRGRLAV
jgi:hypothetical protein